MTLLPWSTLVDSRSRVMVEGSQLLQSYPLALEQLDSTFSAESSAIDSSHSRVIGSLTLREESNSFGSRLQMSRGRQTGTLAVRVVATPLLFSVQL